MKTAFIFLFLFSLIACTKDDIPVSKSQTVISTMSSGIWSITNYNDSGVDETSNFEGFTFAFSTSGAITANIGTAINPGTWSVTDGNSSEDTLDDLHFNMTFSAPPLLAELTDDWEIVEIDNKSIKLVSVSGGGSGADYITFYRN